MCQDCGQLYTSNNKSVSDSNKEIWFNYWIIDKVTFDKISLESDYNKSTLQRYFLKCNANHLFFDFSSTDEIYLILDGTYFPNDNCLVVYRNFLLNPQLLHLMRNFHLKLTQLYRMSDDEHFEEIAEDLQNLLNLELK